MKRDLMNAYFRLMRPEQWYKNILVFLALIFSKNVFNPEMLALTILGFLSLSLVASSYYIINDSKDIEADRLHPDKRRRPLASGSAKKSVASALSVFLFFTGMLIAYKASPVFALFPAALFLTSTLYSIILKKVAILDIHVVALNFLLRAVAGAVLIDVKISPWLVFSIFLIALFLAAGKRMADLMSLGADAKKINIYSVYTEEFLRGTLYILAATIIVAYGLYAFLAHPDGYMMLGLPFVSFMCLRFVHFALTGHAAARGAHRMFLDMQILLALAAWAAVSFAVIYLPA